MAQVLDPGRRGAVVRRHVRGPAEQRRVPAAGHGGPGPPPGRLRAPPHPVGRRRRLLRRDPGRVLPGVRRGRGHRQLPLQPGHAAGVRRLPLAPRQAAGPEAAVPRAAVVAARAGRHVRRAVRVPGVRVRRGRVEGVRARRRAHGARRRLARLHEAVQGQEVAQVRRPAARTGGSCCCTCTHGLSPKFED
uniref:Uncharacterized protein n=1 Tax=Zea mays TaxID=4577 RepID=A0A804LKX8_MAIZE